MNAKDMLDGVDPTLKKYLLSSMAGAVLGGSGTGWLSATGGERFGETPEERRSRIVRNTLLGAAAGGAGTAALVGAGDLLSTAAPSRGLIDKHVTQPISQMSTLTRGILGGGLGATAGAASVLPGAISEGAANWMIQNRPSGVPFISDRPKAEAWKEIQKALLTFGDAAKARTVKGVPQSKIHLMELGDKLRATMKSRLKAPAIAGATLGVGLPFLTGLEA